MAIKASKTSVVEKERVFMTAIDLASTKIIFVFDAWCCKTTEN
jgi:hypothetical protein